MLDPKLLREHYDIIKTAYQARQFPLEILEKCKQLDEEWRRVLQELESLRAQLKENTPKGKPSAEQLEALKSLSKTVKQKQEQCAERESKLKESILVVYVSVSGLC